MSLWGSCSHFVWESGTGIPNVLFKMFCVLSFLSFCWRVVCAICHYFHYGSILVFLCEVVALHLPAGKSVDLAMC